MSSSASGGGGEALRTALDLLRFYRTLDDWFEAILPKSQKTERLQPTVCSKSPCAFFFLKDSGAKDRDGKREKTNK